MSNSDDAHPTSPLGSGQSPYAVRKPDFPEDVRTYLEALSTQIDVLLNGHEELEDTLGRIEGHLIEVDKRTELVLGAIGAGIEWIAKQTGAALPTHAPPGESSEADPAAATSRVDAEHPGPREIEACMWLLAKFIGGSQGKARRMAEVCFSLSEGPLTQTMWEEVCQRIRADA